MDRWTGQIFGGPDRISKVRGSDAWGFTEQILSSFASSAAKRAMSYSDPEGKRSHGAGFDANDFHTLGGFVLEMMQGRGDSSERRRRKEKKRRRREREREREIAQERDIKYEREFDISNEAPYVPKYSTRRRRRSSQSPLHVKFAEPLEDFDYPPLPEPRKHRRRRHRQREEEEQQQEDYERDKRRRERRSRRHRPKIDLRTLKTDLEDMSSTIISLNARSANHRDCEFYDKFVRKGGQLQERIGSTLGQIRGWEEGGGQHWYGYDYGRDYDEEKRERRERKRRRRERENRR